jgi:hypothetical protein
MKNSIPFLTSVVLCVTLALMGSEAVAQETESSSALGGTTQADVGDFDFNLDTTEFDDFGSESFQAQSDEELAAGEAAAGLIMLFAFGLSLLAFVAGFLFSLYIAYSLSSALSSIPEAYREMAPFVPWLIFVPVVNVVILILAFIKVPRSVKSYLASKGNHSHGDCGESYGLWGAILSLLGCTLPVGLVMLILSLNKLGKAQRAAA